MTYQPYVLEKKYFPKTLKDIPWFIEHSFELRLWNIQGYILKEKLIFGYLLMANSDDDCFIFHDWLIENSNCIDIDISFNNFNIVLKSSCRGKFKNIYHYMAKTMDSSLYGKFISHANKLLELPKEE